MSGFGRVECHFEYLSYKEISYSDQRRTIVLKDEHLKEEMIYVLLNKSWSTRIWRENFGC